MKKPKRFRVMVKSCGRKLLLRCFPRWRTHFSLSVGISLRRRSGTIRQKLKAKRGTLWKHPKGGTIYVSR